MGCVDYYGTVREDSREPPCDKVELCTYVIRRRRNWPRRYTTMFVVSEDTYVIRRRKANGKGWEYLRSVGWGPLAGAFRWAEPPNEKPLPRHEQLCRMVPAVRWAVRVTQRDGSLSYHEFCNTRKLARMVASMRIANGHKAIVVKRTTYRPEPVK